MGYLRTELAFRSVHHEPRLDTECNTILVILGNVFVSLAFVANCRFQTFEKFLMFCAIKFRLKKSSLFYNDSGKCNQLKVVTQCNNRLVIGVMHG